jgi:hypothetical protein
VVTALLQRLKQGFAKLQVVTAIQAVVTEDRLVRIKGFDFSENLQSQATGLLQFWGFSNFFLFFLTFFKWF